MVERIERIARIKPIDDEVGRRENYRQRGGNKDSSFLNELRRVLKKKATPSEISDACHLELSGESVGLFYYGNLDLNALLR